jgi:Tol biopolymer transport system component
MAGLLTCTMITLAGCAGEREQVVYEWYPAGGDRKTIVVSNGSLTDPATRVVPETRGAAVHANWSRDGSTIAWEVLDGDRASIWTADADGSDATERVTCLGERCVQMSWPSFTAGDTHLLVTRYDLEPSGDWGPSHLVLVDQATGEQTIIASTADGTSAFYSSTTSPDGATVAATLETYTGASQQVRTGSVIVVVDTDPNTTDPPIAITDPALYAGYPRWHPSDDLIAFASWDLDAYQGDEPSQLYTMESDGTDLRQVTSVDHEATGWRPGEASWSPDGRRLVASIGIVVDGSVTDVRIAYVDVESGEISMTGASGAMPSIRP